MIRRLVFVVLSLAFGCDCPCKAAQADEIPRERFTRKQWFMAANMRHCDLLYVNNSLIGCWNHVTREYFPWENGRWGSPCEAPIPPREPPVELIRKGQNFGVDVDRLRGPDYVIGGAPATRGEVFQALDADVPDDTKKARVTLMGPKDIREISLRGFREWHDKNKLADKVILWSGAEDDAILKQRGFTATPGVLTVFVQDPKGKQLLKIAGTAPDFSYAKVETALNAWDPTLFPNRKPPLPGLPDVSAQTVVLGIVLLAVAGLYLRKTNLA